MKFTETIYLGSDEVRSLCIENNYYTLGDCVAYDNMLDNAYEYETHHQWNLDTFAEIACDIVDHTDLNVFRNCDLFGTSEIIAHVMYQLSNKAHRTYNVEKGN